MPQSAPRVLHFSPFEGLAGANRSCLTLLEEQAKRRSVYAMSLFEGEFSMAASQTGAEVRPIYPAAGEAPPVWQRLPKWRRLAFAARALRNAVNDWKIDIVHCHSPRGVRYVYPAIFGKKTKLITHQRDNYKRDYFHLGLGRSDHLIAISNWVRQTLPRRIQRKTTVVYNAVNLPHSEAGSDFDESRPLVIGMAGRCNPEKGLDILLEALPMISQQFVFEVYLCGVNEPNRDEFSRKIHDMVAAFNVDLRNRVRIEPFRPDIENFFAAVDVVVMPSRFQEPFGRVAIEAMAWRRPVIVSDRGGLPEIVKHGRTGLIFDADRPADLARKLDELLADRDLRRQMADAGRKEVELRFLPGPHADAIDEIYEKTVGAA
jgi:glycosyltransferase involved in cell wall biosynthesis